MVDTANDSIQVFMCCVEFRSVFKPFYFLLVGDSLVIPMYDLCAWPVSLFVEQFFFFLCFHALKTLQTICQCASDLHGVWFAAGVPVQWDRALKSLFLPHSLSFER